MNPAGEFLRPFLSFRIVNRKGYAGYDPGLQRHHLLPRQLRTARGFMRMFAAIGGERRRFEDFRENGLLLPCNEVTAIRMGMPLHRGPHRHYSELVIERVGQIEKDWAARRSRDPEAAGVQARMRLGLLQRALGRYLLDLGRRKLFLNRRDPFMAGGDFSELDAVADALWGATGAIPVEPPVQLLLQPMPERARSSSLAA